MFYAFALKNMLYGSYEVSIIFQPFRDVFSLLMGGNFYIDQSNKDAQYVVLNFGDPLYQKSSICLHIFCMFLPSIF